LELQNEEINLNRREMDRMFESRLPNMELEPQIEEKTSFTNSFRRFNNKVNQRNILNIERNIDHASYEDLLKLDENNVIVPTPKDIIESLPIIKFGKQKLNEENMKCAICLKEFEMDDIVKLLPCLH